jgi:hypothetical protein
MRVRKPYKPFGHRSNGTTVGWVVARNDLDSVMQETFRKILWAGLMAGAIYLLWTDFQDDCGTWLPAWGALEGSARLFQPIILGLIAGLFITVLVVSIYRGLSYLLD